MESEVGCPATQSTSSMDRAVYTAFTPGGSCEALLDHLTVQTMNFARPADGTTPLMAACASGNRPLVELLLDLGCHAMMKDDRGWTAIQHAAASPLQQDLGKLILERVQPPLDAAGKPVHTWDTCSHPAEYRFLDESLGWLICTHCALVLDEKALVMAGEPANGSKNPWAVRGADADYNAWRHDEMEIADAMRRLGVVDNQGAKQRGFETSVWKVRENALSWLDKRRRVILSWQDEARMLQRAGKEIPPAPKIPCYPEEIKSMSTPTGRQCSQRLLNPDVITRPRFKGTKMEEEEEDEELYDPRTMQEAMGDPFAIVAKWRQALARWKSVCQSAVRCRNFRDAGVFETNRKEEKIQDVVAEKTEIQYEYEYEYERA
jgi:hypothetical protein